ncbi:MAG: tRNA (adenosine(37)-N6)-threonylcarbamoyltransferase complex ATPase subunit type 1 TsaE, partial [Bdellovibrionota bacterium]
KSIILLSGSMGAGKTQLTQFLVEALGGTETASPSFAIHNSYTTTRMTIEHLDLFRLENADDLESTGFWDIFLGDDAVVVIEWSDKLADFGLEKNLPASWKKIEISIQVVTSGKDAGTTLDQSERKLKITPPL